MPNVSIMGGEIPEWDRHIQEGESIRKSRRTRKTLVLVYCNLQHVRLAINRGSVGQATGFCLCGPRDRV